MKYSKTGWRLCPEKVRPEAGKEHKKSAGDACVSQEPTGRSQQVMPVSPKSPQGEGSYRRVCDGGLITLGLLPERGRHVKSLRSLAALVSSNKAIVGPRNIFPTTVLHSIQLPANKTHIGGGENRPQFLHIASLCNMYGVGTVTPRRGNCRALVWIVPPSGRRIWKWKWACRDLTHLQLGEDKKQVCLFSLYSEGSEVR